VAGAVVLLARTDWARDRAREQLIGLAREELGLDLGLGEVDYGLVPPSLRITDLSVAGAGAEPFVSVPAASFELAAAPLLRGHVVVTGIEVHEPRVRLLVSGGKVANLPRLRARGTDGRSPRRRPRIDRVRIDGGRIDIDVPDERIRGSLEGIGLDVTRTRSGGQRIVLEVAGGAVARDDRRLRLQKLETSLTLEGGRARLRDLRAAVGPVAIALASFDAALAAPHDGALRAAIRLPFSRLRELPIDAPDIGGELDVGIDARRVRGEVVADARVKVGGLTIRPGRTGASAGRPVDVGDLDLTLRLAGGVLSISTVELRRSGSAGGRVLLEGVTVDLRAPGRPLSGVVRVEGLDVGRALADAGRDSRGIDALLDASATLDGALDPLDIGVRDLEVAAHGLRLRSGKLPSVDVGLGGELRVQKTRTEVARLRISLGGAALELSGSVPFDRVHPLHGTVRSEGTGLDLAPLGRLAGVSLSGTAAIQADVEGTLAAPRVRGEVEVRGLRVRDLAADVLRAELASDGTAVTLPVLRLATGKSAIRLDGARIDLVDGRPRRFQGVARLEPLDLADVVRIARGPAEARSVSGRLTGNVEVDHDVSRSVTVARLAGSLDGVVLGPAPLGRGDVEVSYERDVLRLHALDLRGPQARLHVEGSAARDGPLDVRAELEGYPVSSIRGVSERLRSIEGNIDARLHLTGTRGEPAGSGEVRLDGLRRDGRPLGDSHVEVALAQGVATLHGSLLGGGVTLEHVVLDTNGSRSLGVRGELHDLDLGVLARPDGGIESRLSGDFEIAATPLELDRLVGEARLDTFEVLRGEARLRSESGVALSFHDGALAMRPGRFLVGARDGRDGVTLRVDRLEVGLVEPWPIRARGAVRLHDVRALPGTDSLPDGLRVLVGGTFGLGGDLARLDGLWGRAVFETLEVQRGGLAATAPAPVVLRLRGGRVEIEPARIVVGSPDADDRSWLSIEGFASADDLGLDIAGAASLARLQPLFEKVGQLSGSLRLACRVRGSPAAPTFLGQASLDRGRAVVGGGGGGGGGTKLPFEDISARVRFSQNVIAVDTVRASLHGGLVEASGHLALDGRALDRYHFDLSARDVAVPFKQKSTAVLGADLDIDGTGDEKSLPLLSGRIDVVHLLLRDAAGPRVKRSGVEQPTKALTAERPGEPRVRLDLRIVDHGDVRLEMNLLKGNVTLSRRGQPFRVIGTDVRPALLGTVLIEERSKLTVRNTEFEVERGALRFFDPEKVEARLDVVAAANRRDWHIRLYATGTLSEPRVRFASEPPLSDEDVFMLLSVGMTSAEARQRNRGGVAAEVLWKTAAGGKVARELFPELDVFKVTTEYSPRTGRTEPRIRVGRPLGKNARIDAARGLTAERDLEAVIRYELGRVFSFEGSYRRDPDSAVGDVGIDFGVRTEF
jgi:uncharacterized protein involved in outer membrane biogenesis